MGAETRRADVVALACAEAFRGDGEIFGSGMGTIPMLAARLARATFEPDLMISDGAAFYIDGDVAIGENTTSVEGWIPFRAVFDTLWGGRRHVMMGASQIDRFGNTNISAIGDWNKPTVQLLGVRGGPGNTVNHSVSFWIPNHSPRVFVESVDMVSGVGYDRVGRLSSRLRQHHRLPRVVTDLAVLDFETPDHKMRLRSVHPSIDVDHVIGSTGFDLVVPDEVAVSRAPTATEQQAIEMLDPAGLRYDNVPDSP